MNYKNQERIQKYINIVERIRTSKFVTDTKNINCEINIEVGSSVEKNLLGFDEDDLRSTLIDIRKLTFRQDDVSIIEICDLLIESTDDKKYIENLQKCKQLHSNLMDTPAINMIVNEKTEKVSEIISKWFYGYYFHEQKPLQESLDSLGFVQIFHKFNFVVAINNLIYIAGIVSNNAKLILKSDRI